MQYYTYILYSSKVDKYYIGSTGDIKNRLIKHNKGYNKSTKGGIPWIIVFIEKYETRSEAFNQEMKLKKLKKRKFIERFIKSNVSGPDF
jgi:putative endonuclease